MHKNKRKHLRIPVDYEVVFFWEDAAGKVCSARPRARDASDHGMRVHCAEEIAPGIQVYVDVPRKESAVEALVRHCDAERGGFRIGLEFTSTMGQPAAASDHNVDYYEV